MWKVSSRLILSPVKVKTSAKTKAGTWVPGPRQPFQSHRLRIGLVTGHVRQRNLEAALETPELVHAFDLNAQLVAYDLDSRHVDSSSCLSGSLPSQMPVPVTQTSSSGPETNAAGARALLSSR